MNAARIAGVLAVFTLCQPALATDVALVGMMGQRAVVSINGGAPHVMAAGSVIDGVEVISTAPDHAVFVIDGKRETINLGQLVGGAASGGRETATLTAGSNGTFVGMGQINGRSVRFIADTGATYVVFGSAQADQLGLAWRDAPRGMLQTANGEVMFHLIKVPSIKVGDIVLNNIDCAVQEGGLNGVALLGQSFLNRTDMVRSGTTMTLTKRF